MKNHFGVLKTSIIAVVTFAVAVLVGYIANEHIIQAVIISVLKYLIGIIGVVWFFSMTVYNKLSDLTDISGLDFRQHRTIEVEIRARLHWFWMRAIFIGLLALAMYVPSILSDAKVSIPNWVIYSAFGAFSLSIYSLNRLWAELEEIRELKSHIKEIERREKERADKLKVYKEGVDKGWDADPGLDSFRNEKTN